MISSSTNPLSEKLRELADWVDANRSKLSGATANKAGQALLKSLETFRKKLEPQKASGVKKTGGAKKASPTKTKSPKARTTKTTATERTPYIKKAGKDSEALKVELLKTCAKDLREVAQLFAIRPPAKLTSRAAKQKLVNAIVSEAEKLYRNSHGFAA